MRLGQTDIYTYAGGTDFWKINGLTRRIGNLNWFRVQMENGSSNKVGVLYIWTHP